MAEVLAVGDGRAPQAGGRRVCNPTAARRCARRAFLTLRCRGTEHRRPARDGAPPRKAPMPTPRSATARSFSVALDGFSPAEREALSAYFLRFIDHHTPSYALVLAPAQSDLIVADADQASVVQ